MTPELRRSLRSRSFRKDRIAWAVVAVASAVAALAGWLALHRRVALADSPAAPADDFRLTILAYDAVVDEPTRDHCDGARLAEHLRALAGLGFRPVTLAQVERAYRGREALPARSLLLTFDLGLLTTYRNVDPVLRRCGWPAVVFVDPSAPERADKAYLYWDRLQRMLDSGIWEVGVHPYGMTAEDRASGDSAAAAGAARSNPAATAGAFLLARAALERHLRGGRAICGAARGGIEGAPSPLPLCLMDDLFGVNTPADDPGHLMRLRVKSAWTGTELAQRLSAYGASPARSGPPPDGAWTAQWVPGAGHCAADGERLTLNGRGRSDVWRAGSRGLTDWTLTATVRAGGEGFWVVQEAGIPGGDQWRAGATREAFYLERNTVGAAPQVLARFPMAFAADETHALRLTRRGAGVCVVWDGRALSPTPLPLYGRWHGRVGFMISGSNDVASLEIRQARLAPRAYAFAPVSASPSAEEVRPLIDRAGEIAGVGPPWLVQTSRGFEEQPFDILLLAMLSHRYGWEFLPSVRPSDAAYSGNPQWLAMLMERAATEGWSGLHFDLSGAAPAAGAAWRRSLKSAERLFDRRGLRLYVTPAGGRGEGLAHTIRRLHHEEHEEHEGTKRPTAPIFFVFFVNFVVKVLLHGLVPAMPG